MPKQKKKIHLQMFDEFVQDVTKNPDNYPKTIINCVNRHLSDLADSDSEYYFDRDEANRFIQNVKKFRHWKAPFAGQPFNLQPWQSFLIGSIFGWRRKSNNKRRFLKSYIQVGKKNGKTELAAVLANVILLIDNEEGAEIYFAATTREQANICFRSSRNMFTEIQKLSPKIASIIKLFTHSIVREDNYSFMQPVSAEANNLEGKGAHFAVIDEFHIHKTSEVIDNMSSGSAGRTQPHIFTITTSGFNKQSVCYEQYLYSKKILDGVLKDDSLFAMIWEVEIPDDCKDEVEFLENRNIWRHANPNIGHSPRWDKLEADWTTAKNRGGVAMVDFKTKHFSIWCSSIDNWIPSDRWNSLADSSLNLDPGYIEIGVDLASSGDITAVVLVQEKDGKKLIKPYFFCPESKVNDPKDRKDGVNYQKWAEDGHIIVTPGNTTDYRHIMRFLEKLNKKHDFVINYDSWNSSQFIIEMTENGAECYPVSQGFKAFNPPTREFERLIMEEELIHDGNPVMGWMLSNVSLKYDGDYVRPSKKDSKGKIDGIMAAIMAIYGTMTHEGDQVIDIDDLGVYETHKINEDEQE